MVAVSAYPDKISEPKLDTVEFAAPADCPQRPLADRHRPRRWTVSLLCLPLLLVFSWVMVQRLAACPKNYTADFVQEWTSGRNYWTGRPIYWPLNQSIPHYFGWQASTALQVNAHPPAAVMAALPLGLLDYRWSWLAWNVVSLGLLAASLWLLMRKEGLNYDASAVIPIVTLLLASNPLAQQVVEGQMNLVLLAILMGAWAADRAGHQRLSGTLVGLAAAMKLYPALLVFYFLGARRWKALVATIIAFAAVNLAAVGLFGWQIPIIYVKDVMPAFAHYGNNVGNSSLPGLWSNVFLGTRSLSEPIIYSPAAASIAKLACGLAVAALCTWKSWQAKSRAGRDLAFAACIVGMLLASPITWGHSFVILVGPLLILWRHGTRPIARWLIAAIITLLWLVRPQWIWGCIPGFDAFAVGVAPAGYRIPAVLALTIVPVFTYGLLALFATALAMRPAQGQAPRAFNPQCMWELEQGLN